MLWDVRFLNPEDVAACREFLLRKAQLEKENGRPYELLADMENHLAREHQERAREYAVEALRRDPTLRDAHGELIDAMRGAVQDWNASSHYRLIDFYESYIKENPQCKNAYLSIMDQLIADYRLEEASVYCGKYAEIDDSYRAMLYLGKIAWADGRRTDAFSLWNKMEMQYPNEWCVYHNIADYLTRAGDCEKAEGYYRKALEVQAVPRYVDPIEALAQLYERMGRFSEAISTLREELEIFDKEWNFTSGESADIVRREIQRLEKKIS